MRENLCDKNARCENVVGTYWCYCKPGLIGDGTHCDCKQGYELNDTYIDENSCIDKNECMFENNCHENAICLNQIGSYVCECKTDYFGNGTHCIAKLNSKILVLNSYEDKWNQFFITMNGEIETPECKGNIGYGYEAWEACSIAWNNNMYIFGGTSETNYRQISHLELSRIKRIGTLSFKFDSGGCSSLVNGTIFLCFPSRDSKVGSRQVFDRCTGVFFSQET